MGLGIWQGLGKGLLEREGRQPGKGVQQRGLESQWGGVLIGTGGQAGLSRKAKSRVIQQ